MTRAVAIAVALAIVSVTFAQTENIIRQHNTNLSEGTHYNIDQRTASIEILAGIPGEVFQFEAVVEDSNHQYVGPGDINKIETVGFARDAVVTVVGHNGHPYGAANIKEVFLPAQDSTGVLQEVNIAGDLGDLGPIIADAAGSITVGGSVVNDVGIWTDITGSLTVGDDVLYSIYAGGAIAGPVTVGGDLCAVDRVGLVCASLGSLTVDGDVVGYIQVGGAITGPVTVGGGLCTFHAGTPTSLTCESLGSLTVGRDVVGDIVVTEDITGPVTIVGDVLADINVGDGIAGPVTIGGSLLAELACGSLGDLTVHGGAGPWSGGVITIDGPYAGTMTVHQDLDRLSIDGELTGEVDLPDGALNVIETDVGPIASGGRLHVRFAACSPHPALGHVKVAGDVRGALEVDFLCCPLEVTGALYGDGVRLGHCWVPPPGEILIGDGIASGADVHLASISGGGGGGGPVRIVNGIEVGAHLHVDVVGDTGILQVEDQLAGSLEIDYLWMGALGGGPGTVRLAEVTETADISIHECSGRLGPTGAVQLLIESLAGALRIGGDLEWVEVKIGTPATPVNMTGSIRFAGSLKTGVNVTIYGDLHDPENPQEPEPQMGGGHIIIDGGFATVDPCTITINGSLTGPRPFIAVDYDGWDKPDRWQWGGTVIITKPDPNDPNTPPLELHGNTPTRHVWEITECRGDMDNSGEVNFGDINPFVTALSYVAQYSRDFPGLGALEYPWDPDAGSRAYHGDCNCDGRFDFGDINPFIELVNQYPPCCSHECPCPGGNALGAGRPEPELLAATLAVNVKPELFDDLVALAAAAAKVQTDPQLKVYWEKVHHALAP